MNIVQLKQKENGTRTYMLIQGIQFNLEISTICGVSSSISESLLKLVKSEMFLVDRLSEVADEVDVKLSGICKILI